MGAPEDVGHFLEREHITARVVVYYWSHFRRWHQSATHEGIREAEGSSCYGRKSAVEDLDGHHARADHSASQETIGKVCQNLSIVSGSKDEHAMS